LLTTLFAPVLGLRELDARLLFARVPVDEQTVAVLLHFLGWDHERKVVEEQKLEL
jgi:hypothetical protein